MFSVIIPVHNKLPHLERSINSVLNQSFQNFELLLIDDASTDGSSDKLLEFQDQRIRRFRRDVPGPGGYAARNLGIEEAKYDWIAFLDADDEWLPDHLENMKKLLLQFPDVYLMSCGFQRKNESMKISNNFYEKNKEKGVLKLSLIEYISFFLLKEAPVWTSVVVFRRNKALKGELFPASTDVKRGGDLYAWLKLMCHYKQMAWSNHIGAIYHMDSVNMVTKNATGGTQLLSRDSYSTLVEDLTVKEKRMLKKYFNFLLKSVWLTEVKDKGKCFNLSSKIFWQDNYLDSFKLLLLSITPKTFLRYFLNR